MKTRRVYHCRELERSSSGATSGATRGQLVPNFIVAPAGTQSCRHGLLPVHCPLCGPGPESEISVMPPHPPDDGASRPGWISKWEFERAGKRVTVVVVASGPAGEETLDAREFIERLGEDHQGTSFAIHVESSDES